MATSPPDNLYVTGDVPAEMRQGVELGPNDVARPTGQTTTEETVDIDGTPTTLTRIRLPRPDNIPAGAPKFTPPALATTPLQGSLSYDFPLLPGVQCRVVFQGEVTGDHLEQLLDYLTVACNRLRTQQARERKESEDAGRKTESVPEVRGRQSRPRSKVLPRPDGGASALPAQSEK